MANNLQRICCVCRKLQPTADMVRVVRVGSIFQVQTDRRLNGRGCHVCPHCLGKVAQKKALDRSFKGAVPTAIYDELAKLAATRDKQLATPAQNGKLQ